MICGWFQDVRSGAAFLLGNFYESKLVEREGRRGGWRGRGRRRL